MTYDALVTRAVRAFDDEYHRVFPRGGDAGDHAEATRCGIEAVLEVSFAAAAQTLQSVVDPERSYFFETGLIEDERDAA